MKIIKAWALLEMDLDHYWVNFSKEIISIHKTKREARMARREYNPPPKIVRIEIRVVK